MSYPVDPTQLIQMIKQGQNPQQLMISILQSRLAGTPVGDNLLNLIETGQTDKIEEVARNLYTQQGGKNFDQDFQNFKSKFGLN